jgi:hypothetical protein
MLITLSLLGIIVSMVYVVYGYFSKNMQDFTTMSSENFEIQSFYTLLKEDFFNSDKALCLNGKDLTLFFYDESRVRYIQKKGYLYRQTPRTKDSIPLKKIEIEYLINEAEVTSVNPIKSVSVYTLLFGKEMPLFVYKEYHSNYFISEK